MSFARSRSQTGEEVSQQVVSADRRRWVGLVVLCAGLFLESMNLSSISVQLPVISEDLHLSITTAQFVVSVYLVTYAGFLLLGGRLADLLSRRFVFIAGVTLFGLASLTAGLARGPILLIASRAGQGIGAALTAPAAMSIIVTTFAEGPERNKALVTFVAAVFTPQLIGAHPQPEAVSQALVTGFRPALLLAAAFVLLGAVIAIVSVKGVQPWVGCP